MDIPIFLPSRLSPTLIVVQMNPAHHHYFISYLLRPVPSDVQLFIQAVHIMTFFDCRADLVRQLSRDGLVTKECYRLAHPLLENIWVRHLSVMHGQCTVTPTFPATWHTTIWSVCIKVYCLETAHVCKQPVQSCYIKCNGRDPKLLPRDHKSNMLTITSACYTAGQLQIPQPSNKLIRTAP